MLRLCGGEGKLGSAAPMLMTNHQAGFNCAVLMQPLGRQSALTSCVLAGPLPFSHDLYCLVKDFDAFHN